jgi:hypothetical protein
VAVLSDSASPGAAADHLDANHLIFLERPPDVLLLHRHQSTTTGSSHSLTNPPGWLLRMLLFAWNTNVSACLQTCTALHNTGEAKKHQLF